MATEDEAREAADGEEIQVEAGDLGTTHLQMNLDSKLSSHGEMKDEATAMDSTEGMKVTEDQVLERAPSVVEIPQEDTPNGTHASLNGHMKEGKIANEKPQENGQKGNEQVEASPDGISTDQSSTSNGEEAIDSLGHVENTAEDTSLLKHDNEEPKEHCQQDVEGAAIESKMVHKDTLQPDNDVEPTIDAQQGHNLEPEEVTEDTQPATVPCIPGEEVVAEAPAGVQTSLEPNVDEPDALPNTSGGDQEVLNQESTEETSDPLPEKTEETSHESNVSTSEETTPEHDAVTREPALDVQEVQNQGLAEEIADAKEVDTEQTVHQSGIASEEATPEDNATITEPSSDLQHLNNVESEEIKALEDAKAEETSDQSNVTIAEDATEDKEAIEDMQPVQGLEEEEPQNTGTVDMDEASNQPHADVINNLAEGDSVPACEPQVIGLKEEVKDTGATETQEITQQSAAASEELVTEDNSTAIEPSNDDIQQTLEQGSAEVKHAEVSETQEICHERTISAPEEDSVKDDVTAEVPSCDAQEVENVASVEEIKENTAENIVETSSAATVEEADQENNVLTSEDVPEQQIRGLETEEIQNTEPVETEEASDLRHPALLNDAAQEDIIPSDVPKTESTVSVEDTEAIKTEALPQESNVSISEEPASEQNITAREVSCDDLAREAAVDMQSAQELQSEKKKNAEFTEVSEASGEMDAAVIENPTHEDNLTISESLVMESAEVSSNEATEGQEMPQSDATQSEDHKTEENMAVSEPQILEPEPAEEMRDSEATKPRAISQESMSVPKDETAKEAASDIKEVQTEELIEKPDDVKTEEISNQNSGTIVGETAQEDKLLSSDPTGDVQAKKLESQKIGNSEDVQIEEASHQTDAEENLTENEPQITTEDNTAILTDVNIQQLQEPEPVEFRDTEATEPQGISPSHTVSGSEQSTPEDNEMTEPSPATQAENLESAIVREESKDVKSTDAIAEEETPREHVQESGAHVDIPPVENTEPVEVHDNVMTDDLPAEEVKDNEAIEVAEIHYESPVANIGDLTEDAKSNVALEDEAAPDEDVKATEATAAIPQPQEPELEEIKNSESVEVEDNIIARDLPAEEIKDIEAMETEMIPHESTGANISELINDVKSNVALADEAAPDEHAKATEATGAIPQPQEPDLEEIKNSEPAELEGNISANDLPAEEVKDTEAVETEAINESTDANNSELPEDVKNNVALADEAAPEEHVTVADDTVDMLQAQEPEVEEMKNTEPVEVEENVSASELPAEEVKDTEAINKSADANTTELTEEVKCNVALAAEEPHEEHVTVAETAVDIPQPQELELEEIKNTEPVEVEENMSASDMQAEEVKDTEAINESTDANISELTEDVKTNVALADEAAPEEHVIATEATVDIPQAQDPELEEIKNTETVEVEENISASDLPAEEVKDAEAKETEAITESTDANISELTEDVKSNVTRADEAAPEEHVIAAEAAVDIPQAQVSELQELENVEPDEVEENRSAGDLPAEEVKEIEAKETEAINESTDANISELTGDVTSNVTHVDEAAPEEHVTATEATVDIPRAQEPELEEIENVEPVEVEENTSVSDMPAEAVKDTEAKETEAINESTDANISELTEDMESNVALIGEAAHEEHVTVAKTTVDIPQAQEPELEEIKNTEAGDLSAEEVKEIEPKETEAISGRTDANISELNEDVKSNIVLADEEPHAEHVTVAERTVDIPQAQEPEPEEIKNTEPVEVEENRSASDLQAEEVKETEAINESPDANISELTEDVTSNVAHADEAAPEEHVIASKATVDIPRAQERDLEEIKNTEPVEVEEFISASDLPTEEVKETETKETEAINESTDPNINELTEDVKGNIAHADEAAPEEHVIAAEATDDIPQAQVPELEELKNTEPVEVEENKSATDLPAEEVKDTETMETEAVHKSADTNISELTEDVTLADEAAADVQIDVPLAKEPALEEMKNIEPVEAQDGITPDNVPAEEINDTEAMETGEIPHESTDDSLTASAALPDIQQVPEQEAVEDKACTDTTENQGEPQQSIVSTSAELTPTEEETAVVKHTQDTHVQNASSEPGTDPNLLVQSAHQSELAEDSKGQLVKAEETGQSNGATLEEPTAEDNAANEIGPLADSKQERGLESVEENKCIDATEGEEASHLSQDPGLEEPVSERDIATVEPTSDIQQVNDMDEAEEITATEAINGEEISSQKTEVATLEEPSPTDNGTAPEQNPVELDEENLGNEISNAILADENIKEEIQEPREQKDESSDLGEKTAFTTHKDESATEEDVVQISGEDTVGTSNNIEQIKELPKSVIEHSGDHTDDQDDEQLHNVELQMQVCERSVDLTTEQPDDHVQKVNLDQQKKEDEAIEKQTEEIQTDEQNRDDSRADFTRETILEPQSNEIVTTNRKDDADVFEAEQTEAVTTEMLKNEQTLHIAQESIPSITDAKVENSTEIEETTAQEDAPNNTGTLYTDADAEKYNEDEKENTEIDAAVAKTSTDEQDGTTDETKNEEVENYLGLPVEKDLQKASDLAPSNEEMLENDPTVVPQNVESRVHSEEKECINNANDGMQAIQASEEEIVDEVEKKEEIQNEDTNVNHDEIETKLVDEEASGLQDLSFHPKVVDDKLATEQNGAEVETDSNEEMATGYTAVTESVKRGEAIYDKAGGSDVALSDENLETIEDNRRNLEASPAVTASGESMNEDNEHHKPALPAHSAVDGNETEQASGLEVTERELFPEKPLPTESEEQEESQITKEQDGENVQEQETDDTEKEEKEAEQSYLPVSHFLMNLIMGKESNEPDGNSEFKAEKKQEETTKDGSSLITSQQEESLVPIPTENKVDNERIFEQGKHNIEGSEETHDIELEKDEELNRDTHDLEAPVCQNNVQGETSSEMVPGGSGLTTEMETRDIKLGEKATNSVCQEHMEATTQIEEGSLKSNLHDITNPKVSQEDTLEEGITDLQHKPLPENRSSDAVSGQTLLLTEPNMGDEKNLPNDTDDLQSPLSTKREESNESSNTEAESTVEAELENGVDKEEKNQQTTTTGGVTEEQIENEHDISQKSTEAISDEQKGEITEPVMGNEIILVPEKGISAGSECKDEKQSSKFSNSELDNSEKALEIQLDGSSLHIDQDKQDESAGDQIVMEKNNLLDKPGESDLQKLQEMEVAQESPEGSDEGDQISLPIREPVIKEVNVNKTVDSHVQTVNTQSQEEQETFNSQVHQHDLDVASPEEAPEAEEKIVESKPEFSTDEEQSPKKDESNMAGEKTYDEKTKGAQEAKSLPDEAKTKVEEQGVVQKASHNQKRDLDVVSLTEAPGSEETVVDIKEPEFSTDEEESPKKDVSNMAEEKSYDKKTNGDEEAKNFTDDAPTKIEDREAGQKASPKKHNILSGVGSKVKHQLAKVKKAIIGKPGHTKSESPKA
ncbi:titin isoform X3 [Triticum aestivum]|uniref:titin isoform X3 n=1 Tax=Triticum aestivum TaxID=4565 RepID=UPI001D021BC9|nr:titin-like isoform X3 [Triticum aestivum]